MKMKTLAFNKLPRLLLVGAAALVLTGISAMAEPVTGTLWFSGDPNGGFDNGNSTGATNWGNDATTQPDALTEYQEFDVTDAAGWTISDVYSLGNAQGFTTAQWEILTGMGVGNPGTEVAGGTGPVNLGSYDGQQVIDVSIGSLFLAQGDYWLEVAVPIGEIATTDGTNSIGTTPVGPDASLRNWPVESQYYQNYGIGAYSEGVAGIVGTASTPEPSTWFSLAAGMAGMALLKFHRRSSN